MSNDLLGFSQRLKEVLAENGQPEWGRQRFLSRQFGVTHPSAKRWLDGTGYPETATLSAIATWSNTTVDWLLTGRGLKYPIDTSNQDLIEIVNQLSKANPEQIAMAKGLITVLLSKKL